MSSASVSLASDPMLPLPYRISAAHPENGDGDVFTWSLRPTSGTRLAYQPGQFNMLYLFGSGEVPISISGDPRAGVLVHTIRAVGTVTRPLQALGVGAIIGVRGPYGSCWPLAQAAGKHLLVIAGGIGLAPLRPVLCEVARAPQQFPRVSLFYGVRTPRSILYRRDLGTWARCAHMDVQTTVDQAAPRWRGEVGVVTKLIERAAFDPAQVIAMICGPEVMMHFAILALHKRGVREDQIYLSMERNMHCAVGYCGHCQWDGHFLCKDGPVFRLDRIAPIFDVREL